MKNFILILFLLMSTALNLYAQTGLNPYNSCGLSPFPEAGSRAVYGAKYRDWKTGDEIHVYFKNGTDIQHGMIEHYIRAWEAYGRFDIVVHAGIMPENSRGVHVEITDLESGTSGLAYVGAAGSGKTVSFWLDELSGLDMDTIIHEFGHTLGFSHEQENPSGKYLWKKEEAYKYFESQYGMSRMEVDAEVFNNNDAWIEHWGDFDPWSVMGYQFPGYLFEDGRSLGQSLGLSVRDAEGVKAAYPGRTSNYHFPVLLYSSYEDVNLNISMQSGEMDIYINEKLFKTVGFDDIPDEYVSWFHNSLTVQITEEVKKNKFTKIYYVHRPDAGGDEAQLSLSSADDYIETIGTWDRPEPLPLSDGTFLGSAFYLAHYDNRNTSGPDYYKGLNAQYEVFDIDYYDFQKVDEESSIIAADRAVNYNVDAVMNWGAFYFFNGRSYIEWDRSALDAATSQPVLIHDGRWLDLSFDKIDAVLDLNINFAYFFSGNQYIKFNKAEERAAAGYPKNISESTWSGLSFEGLDAAVAFDNGKAYFFKGNQYIRYDLRRDKADQGYPKTINSRTWPGLTFEKIDAAVNAGNGKIFFFSGNEYIRYDIGNDEADSGYPRTIEGNWPGLKFPVE